MFNVFKTKNKKRAAKAESLSVKSRAGQVRAHRVRLVSTLFGFSLSLFLLVMIGWKGVEWVMREGVYKNPNLAIDTIEIETDGVVSPDKIREWARVKLGDNLLALDLNRIKRDLELRPIVESASAEKILPRTLRIGITERRPVAMVYLYHAPTDLDRIYLDANAIVIPPLRRDERNPKSDPNASILPVLTGFSARLLRPGQPVDSPEIRAALDLLVQYDHAPVALMTDFKSVDLGSPRTLTVTTDQNFQVTFATENYGQQLARLQSIIELGRRDNRTLASLDLAVGNYVPARWMEASTNSPTLQNILPVTLKPRKKHV
jgi:cell division septal protein FtsQ